MERNRSIEIQECFVPPYCPNESCEFHIRKDDRKFYRNMGWGRVKTYPFFVKKYQCNQCKRNFRYSYFKFDYRQQRRGINFKIFFLFTLAVSNREISRRLHCSEHLIRRRLKLMSQWALLEQSLRTTNYKLTEPIIYDGLEAYAISQYEPNQIQQAIGKESLFIHDFNFVPLNRKGKMSLKQKRVNKYLESNTGRYDPKAIRKGSVEIFRRLYEKRADLTNPFILCSDRHFQYRRAVEIDLKDLNIQHVTVSSKATRNYKNVLFPINHADLLIRQHCAAFRRETIAFAKTHERMIQKYALFMVWKNFFRTQFVKPHARDPETNRATPAMRLGIVSKPLEFHEFFNTKRTLKQVTLSREWNCFYHEIPTYQRCL